MNELNKAGDFSFLGNVLNKPCMIPLTQKELLIAAINKMLSYIPIAEVSNNPLVNNMFVPITELNRMI